MKEQRPKLIINTAPVTWPVSTAETINYLKQDSANVPGSGVEETLIISMIKSATESVQTYLKRVFITQKWTLIFDYTPPRIFYLPQGQLTAVDSINVYDEDGDATLQNSDDYSFDAGDFGAVYLKGNTTWTTSTRLLSIMKVIYTCGWADAAAVPFSIKEAILQLISRRYMNRGTKIDINQESKLAQSIASTYLIYPI